MIAFPFILGERDNLALLPNQCGPFTLTKIPIQETKISLAESLQRELSERAIGQVATDIQVARFARLLNLANGYCYGGGMGMPEWVMLDCALLPACFIGWMTPAVTLKEDIRAQLNQALEQSEAQRSTSRVEMERRIHTPIGPLHDTSVLSEWVPTSEFCSIPRLGGQEVVGYSLYSLTRGLGVRAKALGLWVMSHLGITAQLGVAQRHNFLALRTHLRFGPLELVDPMTPLHTQAGDSIIYRLLLPPREQLKAMALGQISSYQPPLNEGQGISPHALEWVEAQDCVQWLALRSLTQQRVWIHQVKRQDHHIWIALHRESNIT